MLPAVTNPHKKKAIQKHARVGGKNSHKNFDRSSDQPVSPAASPSKSLLVQWWEDLEKHESMKRSLHPEDESLIIEFLHTNMT